MRTVSRYKSYILYFIFYIYCPVLSRIKFLPQAWLGKAANCPLCRCELPTDDPEWEEMRRQKKRKEKREQDLEALHDSMFG